MASTHLSALVSAPQWDRVVTILTKLLSVHHMITLLVSGRGGVYAREFDAFVATIDRAGWGRKANMTELTLTAENAAAG
jgi:hypothetical protein